MTFDPVTYEDVREACCALLGAGEGPSRPKVQDLLAEKIGRKGSNSVVQGFINRFWAEAAERMNMPARQVADVPEEFVPVIDRALVEMVGVARKMAAEELSAREAAIEGQIKDWQARIQQANDAAGAAEQLRLRAEGELNGMQSIVVDLRASVKSLEDKLADETKKNEAHQQTISEKDVELARQFAALEAAGQKFDSAAEAHRLEVNRLLQQVDDERQSSKRESQALRQQVEAARTETESARRELSAQREECARMRAEIAANATTMAAQTTTIEGLKSKLDSADQALRQAQKDVTVLQVRYETAEGLRKAAEEKCTNQAEELGELRQSVLTLEIEKIRLIDAAKESEKPGPQQG
jgi:chromosome segregation ATPase